SNAPSTAFRSRLLIPAMGSSIQRPVAPVPVALQDIEGFSSALGKKSHVSGEGKLRLTPIEGVSYRLLRPVSHRDGHLTEAFRADWGMTEAPIVQVNTTVTFPG